MSHRFILIIPVTQQPGTKSHNSDLLLLGGINEVSEEDKLIDSHLTPVQNGLPFTIIERAKPRYSSDI